MRSEWEVRVFGIIDRIHKPLPPLPIQRRALPGLVFRQQLDNARLTLRIIRLEEHPGSLPAREVFVFVRGTRLEDTDQVLKGALTRGDRLRSADPVGNVSFELDSLLFRFLRNSEVCFPWDARLYLDEIDAAAL